MAAGSRQNREHIDEKQASIFRGATGQCLYSWPGGGRGADQDRQGGARRRCRRPDTAWRRVGAVRNPWRLDGQLPDNRHGQGLQPVASAVQQAIQPAPAGDRAVEQERRGCRRNAGAAVRPGAGQRRQPDDRRPEAGWQPAVQHLPGRRLPGAGGIRCQCHATAQGSHHAEDRRLRRRHRSSGEFHHPAQRLRRRAGPDSGIVGGLSSAPNDPLTQLRAADSRRRSRW